MIVKDLLKIEELELVNPDANLSEKVEGVFICDLLSWVIGNTEEHQVWLTVQNHLNVVAVAHLRELSAIIFVQGSYPLEDTIQQANDIGMPLFVSELSAYDLSKVLAKEGL